MALYRSLTIAARMVIEYPALGNPSRAREQAEESSGWGGAIPLPDGRGSDGGCLPLRLKSARTILEHGHRLTLLLNHVVNRRLYLLMLPQVASTAMARPSLLIGAIDAAFCQTTADVRLEIIH